MEIEDIVQLIPAEQRYYLISYSLRYKIGTKMLSSFVYHTILTKKKVKKVNSISKILPISNNVIEVSANVVFKERNKEYPINSSYKISLDDVRAFCRNMQLNYLFEENL